MAQPLQARRGTLYAVGLRLDEDPAMLFRLRQVAHAELLTRATAALAGTTPPQRGARRAIAADRLAAMFGIELETDPTPPRPPSEGAKVGFAPAATLEP